MAEDRLTDEERAIMAQGRSISRDMAKMVGQRSDHIKALDKYVAEIGGETVVANSPRQFILTLDGPPGSLKQVRFPQGPCEVPASLIDHWYVKAHNVKAIQGARIVRDPLPSPESTETTKPGSGEIKQETEKNAGKKGR